MCKVLIFGGTTEGRILAEYCSENRIPAYVSVVSEYGRELLKEDLYVRPLTGPMDAGQMRAFIADEAIELVVDATHPYARNATENIKSACRDTGTAYLRYLRNTEDERENAGDELFSTPEEAAKWLEETKGNIFVTTGSNELAAFAGTEKLKHRIFARVLPSSFAVGKCEELGITGKHLICMQGPFTKEMNAAMLRQTNAAYLVTKETGKAGGFDEKLEAARECKMVACTLQMLAFRSISQNAPIVQSQWKKALHTASCEVSELDLISTLQSFHSFLDEPSSVSLLEPNMSDKTKVQRWTLFLGGDGIGKKKKGNSSIWYGRA